MAVIVAIIVRDFAACIIAAYNVTVTRKQINQYNNAMVRVGLMTTAIVYSVQCALLKAANVHHFGMDIVMRMHIGFKNTAIP